MNYIEDVVEVIAEHGDCGEKPITIAYRDYSVDEFEILKQVNENFETENSRLILEEGLTLFVTIGL